MKSTTRLVAFALALTAGLSSAATAQTPEPPPSRSTEVAIAGGQLLLGAGTAVGMVIVAGAAGAAGPPSGLAVLLVAPAVTGATVCWLGGKSPSYDDNCKSAVLGSYLGALAMIPGGLLGAYLADNGEQDMSGAIGFVGGLVVGYLAGTSVGATIGWHVGKERRQPPAIKVGTPGPLQPRLLAFPGRPRLTRAAGEVSFPILSLTF